tara:strand:+ start:52 stop:327 length:276 start_codon:yes stop_codon:yes gene_type:complete
MSDIKKIFEILSKDTLTVRDLLSIQYTASERTMPSDIIDNEYERHFSKNKQEYEDILDMDLTHLVRAFSKSKDKISKKELIKETLRELLDE